MTISEARKRIAARGWIFSVVRHTYPQCWDASAACVHGWMDV
jgi:hypothetical protein